MRKDHKAVCCLRCTLNDMDTEAQHECHTFVPAAGETAGESEHEHDWSEWGAVYHGGHLQWRKCSGCIEVQSTPEGHFCPDCAPVCESPKGCHAPSACQESCAFGDQLRGIRMVPRSDPEPEAPECACPDDWWSSGEAVHTPGCPCTPAHRRETPLVGWDDPPPPRRPPYAVAYELEDGTAYEVALPGDATVGSLNGALIISHTSSPVKGLTQARPMEQ